LNDSQYVETASSQRIWRNIFLVSLANLYIPVKYALL